jgi:phospholipid/cholesterol/gamma-HCH transport system substrate-binding protein
MQTARDVLQNIDKVLSDNSAPLHSAITNIDTSSGALARNSSRLDQIVEGLIRFAGGTSNPKLAVYDIVAPRLRTEAPMPSGQLAIPEPTAVVALDSQRILVQPADGAAASPEGAQWGDTVPKLLQARIIQSFENADYVRVNRPSDAFSADYQLMIDLHRFQIDVAPEPVSNIEFSAKLVNTSGQVLAAKVFGASAPAIDTGADAAVKALNLAFEKASSELVFWTFKTLSN